MNGRAASSLRACFQASLPCPERRRPCSYLASTSRPGTLPSSTRLFSSSRHQLADGRSLQTNRKGEAKEHNHDDGISQKKEKQTRTPWHREGSSLAPVSRPRTVSAMTKGKLLTTPSRLLKLIIPLTTLDHNNDRKDVEPLALLVHPQQPLSYLERLIQSELPTIKKDNGEDKIPAVHFRAEDSTEDAIAPSSPKPDTSPEESEDGLEETKFSGKTERTGILNPKKRAAAAADAAEMRGGPGEGGVESYSGRGREGPDAGTGEPKFVRWSSSTEIGDFIRDAARGKEFAVEIEGATKEIRIGVPSFNDRTHYLRQRLRKTSKQIAGLAAIKKECDLLAHRAGQRVALSGFGGVLTWWVVVYYLTFRTSLGWDTMEPVTYLVGLSGIMCGYLWFLYHNREVSYRSAMNLTVSRRQSKLYASRGFNLERWEELVKEGNQLRGEIKAVAAEYDVDWHEAVDEHNKTVTEALKEDRRERKGKGKGDDEEEGGEKKKKGKEDDDDD